MGNKYTLSAYKHASTLVKGIESTDVNLNMQQIISSGSGAVYPTFVSVGTLQPEVSFETSAIKTALAAMGGIVGAALNNDTFYFQKMAATGRAGASSHTKVVMASGLIVPTQITANALPGESKIGYRAVPISADGSASPLAITASQSLEAGQDLVDEVYVLGGAEVNGTALDGVESWTLVLNIVLEIITHSGHVYPTFVGIQTISPVITIQTSDVDAFASWGIEGAVQGATNSTVQLLDQTAGGARGSNPITLSVDAGMINFQSLGGRHGQLVKGPAAMTPVYDGTNAIVAVSGIS
ncbi:MAG: hypothetical protein PHY02_06335 [Phycisphaerae bacterium]|nr:hypothetical protein [Phycisphaerae bacterium]